MAWSHTGVDVDMVVQTGGIIVVGEVGKSTAVRACIRDHLPCLQRLCLWTQGCRREFRCHQCIVCAWNMQLATLLSFCGGRGVSPGRTC